MIRDATDADRLAVLRWMLAESHGDPRIWHYLGEILRERGDSRRPRERDFRSEFRMHVAVDDHDRPVGYAMLVMNTSEGFVSAGPVHVVVRKSHRRRGYGLALMLDSYDLARREGSRWIFCCPQTDEARALCIAAGMEEEVGRDDMMVIAWDSPTSDEVPS